MKYCCGMDFSDIFDIDRRMNKNKVIKFMSFNSETEKITYYEFNKCIDDFDETVTQIECIGENKYICANWKSHKLVLITTIPHQNKEEEKNE
jgi:hypothetical protein